MLRACWIWDVFTQAGEVSMKQELARGAGARGPHTSLRRSQPHSHAGAGGSAPARHDPLPQLLSVPLSCHPQLVSDGGGTRLPPGSASDPASPSIEATFSRQQPDRARGSPSSHPWPSNRSSASHFRRPGCPDTLWTANCPARRCMRPFPCHGLPATPLPATPRHRRCPSPLSHALYRKGSHAMPPRPQSWG